MNILNYNDRKLVRIQENGQVTLPAEGRSRRGIKKGDLVEIRETADGWIVTPTEVIAFQVKTPFRDPKRTLTDEEVQRGLAALDRAKQIRLAQRASRNGKSIPSSVDLIHQEREERSRRA